MPKLKLIAAKFGTTTGDKPRDWGNATFVTTVNAHGAQVDVIVGLFVGKPAAEKLSEKLAAAKAAGTQLTVEVENLQLSSENGSYVNEAGERKYRTNHSIVGGKFGVLTESARTTTNADIAGLVG